MDAFLALSRMDVLEEAPAGDPLPPDESYATRELLYNDVLLDLYGKNYENRNLREHYQELSGKLKAYGEKSPGCREIFAAASLLADFMTDKCGISSQLRKAYEAGDRKTLKELADVTLPALIRKVEALRAAWREQWFAYNKPFGFELLDIRFGGIAARLETAAVRIREYLNGDTDRIEELEAERLPMDSVYAWANMLSGSTL